VLPLDSIVINTEAHPLPRFELGNLFSTGWKRKDRGTDGKIVEGRKAGVKAEAEVVVQEVGVVGEMGEKEEEKKKEGGS